MFEKFLNISIDRFNLCSDVTKVVVGNLNCLINLIFLWIFETFLNISIEGFNHCSDVTKVVVGHRQLQMTFEGTETQHNASLKQTEERKLIKNSWF